MFTLKNDALMIIILIIYVLIIIFLYQQFERYEQKFMSFMMFLSVVSVNQSIILFIHSFFWIKKCLWCCRNSAQRGMES